MEKGTRVMVSTPNLINYPLEGEVVQEGIAFNGQVMSKVRFSTSSQIWYTDQTLKAVSLENFQNTIH
jgi:hypothetical protein